MNWFLISNWKSLGIECAASVAANQVTIITIELFRESLLNRYISFLYDHQEHIYGDTFYCGR